MARSLGLAAYRAMARRSGGEAVPEYPARPAGELVWLHAGEPGNLLAVQDLAQRLCAMRDGLEVIITLPETPGGGVSATGTAHPAAAAPDGPVLAHPNNAFLQLRVPAEHPAAVEGFLDHWQPDCCIWVWGDLRPNLILETAARACPMFLVDADSGGFDGRRDRWLPDVTTELVTKFEAVLTRSESGQRRLQQLGVSPAALELTTGLLAGGQALRCSDSDLEELSAAIGGRPVWFAAQLATAEIPVVLAAHRQAMRLSHRLLLVMQPADPADAATAQTQIQSRDFASANWSDGQFPDEGTQVLLSEDAADRGVFFRIAPVSFLGSSLVPGGGGCDPFEAAALGSAVLYGPKVRTFMPFYSRLAAAGAARIVNDAAALGTAVSRLIAPDHAAAMAHAGWDVVSQGAALTDKVIDLVQEALDTRVRNR